MNIKLSRIKLPLLALAAAAAVALFTTVWTARQNPVQATAAAAAGEPAGQPAAEPAADPATDVIVGTVLRNHCRLTPDGNAVMTVYEVRVEQVLGGGLKVGSKVDVGTLGGLVLLKKDGSEVSESNRLKRETAVTVEVPGPRVRMDGVASTKYTEPEFNPPMADRYTYTLHMVWDSEAGNFRLTAPPQQ